MKAGILLSLALLLGGGCAKSPPPAGVPIPLPFDLQLAKPGSEVPAAFAAFAGAWGGDAWNGILPHILVVEQMEPNGVAHAVYALGNGLDGKTVGTWTRWTGTVTSGRLHFEAPNGPAVDYTINTDGALLGRYSLAAQPLLFA